MAETTFSVVIPTFNRADLIGKTIHSVLQQRDPDFEVIVVDDGSTDQTDVAVRAIDDPRVRYFKKENGERGAARNYGTQRAHGHYITFLDSDDLLLPEHLSLARQFISRDGAKRPGAFFHGYEVIVPNKPIRRRLNKAQHGVRDALVKQGNFLACPGVFLRQDIARRFPFVEDRELAGSEDYELWLRIMSCTQDMAHNPVVTFSVMDHADRSVRTIDPEKLIRRKELMVYYIFSNPQVESALKDQRHLIESGAWSYVALHLALAGYKHEGREFLKKTLDINPRFRFTRRYAAILRYLWF